jgi:hypothetical protein
VKIDVTTVEALIREKGGQDETQFITKCVGKTKVWVCVGKTKVWVPVISLCKFLFPVTYTFDGLLCQNWPFSPPP